MGQNIDTFLAFWALGLIATGFSIMGIGMITEEVPVNLSWTFLTALIGWVLTTGSYVILDDR
jgi:hypothetical protein